MVRENQSHAVGEILEVVGLEGLGALKLQVDQGKPLICRLAQNSQLSGDRPFKLATIDGSPTGRDEGRLGVHLQESLKLGQCGQRLGKVV